MKARKEVQTIRQHQQEEHAVVAYSGSGRESMPGTSSSTGQQPGGGGGAADLPMELPSAVAPAQLHSRPSTTPGSAIASVSGARGAARGTSGNGQQVSVRREVVVSWVQVSLVRLVWLYCIRHDACVAKNANLRQDCALNMVGKTVP